MRWPYARGRVCAPSFDEDKTVKTSITSLQCALLSAFLIFHFLHNFQLTPTWNDIFPPALPFLVGAILDQADMRRAGGVDYWIRIGNGKDRRRGVEMSPGSVPRRKGASFFSKRGVGEEGLLGVECDLRELFALILRRRSHENQNQDMKDMHPWNLDFLNKSEMG